MVATRKAGTLRGFDALRRSGSAEPFKSIGQRVPRLLRTRGQNSSRRKRVGHFGVLELLQPATVDRFRNKRFSVASPKNQDVLAIDVRAVVATVGHMAVLNWVPLLAL